MDQNKIKDTMTGETVYVLLDWGGNVEQEKEMTAAEAKKANEYLFEKELRLLRWAPKESWAVKNFGY